MSTTEPTPLKHTHGGSTTRDATDVGVAMAPATTPQSVGPEDAAGLEPTRGDYAGRTQPGSTIEAIPEAEQVPGGTKVRRVQQGAQA
ncbi:MAG: hypothetical protein ACR2NB_06410 [Solirubrobacteraceae bacterium]